MKENVKIPLRICLGKSKLSLKEIINLEKGSVISLNKKVDDKVFLESNDEFVEHGCLFVNSKGKFSVKILKKDPFSFQKKFILNQIINSNKKELSLLEKKEKIEFNDFEFFKQCNTENLGNSIINEHPQTIAVIFYYLSEEKLKEISEIFPKDLFLFSLKRMKEIKFLSHEIKNEVLSSIKENILKYEKKLFDNQSELKYNSIIKNLK